MNEFCVIVKWVIKVKIVKMHLNESCWKKNLKEH